MEMRCDEVKLSLMDIFLLLTLNRFCFKALRKYEVNDRSTSVNQGYSTGKKKPFFPFFLTF